MNCSYEENRIIEQKITSFIVHNYFETNGISIIVNDDNEFQYAGIDIFSIENGQVITYDLKAASSDRYINNPPDSFILPLKVVTRDNRLVDGWLMDRRKVNNKYMFIWMNKINDDNGSFEEEDIEELSISIIDKEKLLDYIFNCVIDRESLNSIIENNNDDIKGMNLGYGFRLCKYGYNIYLIADKMRIEMLSDSNKIITKVR